MLQSSLYFHLTNCTWPSVICVVFLSRHKKIFGTCFDGDFFDAQYFLLLHMRKSGQLYLNRRSLQLV